MTKQEIMKMAEFDASHSNMSGRDAMFVKGITIDAANNRTLLLIEALADSNEKLVEALGELCSCSGETSPLLREMDIKCPACEALADHAERMRKMKENT